jgi:hypothetical protein
MFVREYDFTITEHDLDRPWIVLGREHRTVTLGDEESFFEWAAENWPAPRWTVELAPWQLAPRRRSDGRAGGPLSLSAP